MNNNETATNDPAGLPPWGNAELPAPLPFNWRNVLRTIGPGAILLAGAIGGGEWIVGPAMAVQHGREILWIATVAIVLQSLLNMEIIRYTLYTGEPILTGFMRLPVLGRGWGVLYGIAAVAQLGVPAMAAGCSTVLFAAYHGRLPENSNADTNTQMWIAAALIVATLGILLSGRSVEKVLERASWFMIVMIFLFLVATNAAFVPWAHSATTARGFVSFGQMPATVDLLLLCVFAATAGSGGVGNLAISNWARDKGFGMGAHVGGIGGLLHADEVKLAPVGKVFPTTAENLRRWSDWWKYVLVDQSFLWAIGCVAGMFLTVNLATTMVPQGTKLAGYEAGAFQAKYLAEQLWSGFWLLTLLNGFWILFSTHLSNTDCVVRLLTDMLWANSGGRWRWSAGRVYAALLVAFTGWSLVALHWGSALDLFKILGLVASPVLAVAALHVLWSNTTLLPAPIRPPLWRRLGLVLCFLFYAWVSMAAVLDLVARANRRPIQRAGVDQIHYTGTTSCYTASTGSAAFLELPRPDDSDASGAIHANQPDQSQANQKPAGSAHHAAHSRSAAL